VINQVRFAPDTSLDYSKVYAELGEEPDEDLYGAGVWNIRSDHGLRKAKGTPGLLILSYRLP